MYFSKSFKGPARGSFFAVEEAGGLFSAAMTFECCRVEAAGTSSETSLVASFTGGKEVDAVGGGGC